MGDHAVEAILARLSLSLLPGGCVVLQAFREPTELRAAAIARLRAELWGAGPRTAPKLARMVERVGFRNIDTAPPAGVLVPMVAFR